MCEHQSGTHQVSNGFIIFLFIGKWAQKGDGSWVAFIWSEPSVTEGTGLGWDLQRVPWEWE